jgi:hypothetical protein
VAGLAAVLLGLIQEVSILRGAGSTPAWCRIRQTVAAPTR